MTTFRSSLLRVLGIAALVLASASWATAGPNMDLAIDFRGGRPVIAPWRLFGSGSERLVLPEEGGLRLSSPADRTPGEPVGFLTNTRVRGDFDISCAYEVIQIDRPTGGWGAGLEFFVMTDTPTNEAFDLMRMVRANGADVVYCSRNTSLSGKREFHVKTFPTSGSKGWLRMTRTGREVTAWAAGEQGDYRDLARYDLGPEDLKMVRFGAQPGVAKTAVDVRVLDAKIHCEPPMVTGTADFMVPALAPSPLGAEDTPGVTSRRWFPVAALLGVVILLAVATRYFIVRRRSSERAPAKS